MLATIFLATETKGKTLEQVNEIVNAISSSGANIYHAEVDNLNKDTPIGYQYLLFTINVLDKSRIDELLGRLDKLGYKYRIIG